MEPMEAKEKVRSSHWDNIKGILMLLTVFGHFLYAVRTGPLTNLTVTYLYTFHMPVFVFVSGYFGKSERSRSAPAITKLIFIYVVFNSLMMVIMGHEKLISPVSMMWYIFALAVWRLTAHRIAQLPMVVLLLMFASVLIGFDSTVGNEFAAARVLGFFPYYMGGFLFTEEKYKNLTEKKLSAKLLMGIPLLILTAALIVIGNKIFIFTDHLLMMNYYMRAETSIGRILQFLIGFLAVYVFLLLTPMKKLPFITAFGKYTLPIYLFHRAVTVAAEQLFKHLPEPAVYLLSIVFTFIVCVAFGNSFVSSKLEKLTDDAAHLLDGNNEEKKKFTPAAAALLIAALAFIFVMVKDAYSGFHIEDLKELGKDPET